MKLTRQAAILDLIRSQKVSSHEQLRTLLTQRGFDVAQATLSRDLREMGLAKTPGEDGNPVYVAPSTATEPTPVLARLLSALYLRSDGVGNLLVVKTVAGGAQPVAGAIDAARWSELVGTVAGDDSILLILRGEDQRETVLRRLENFAGLVETGASA